MKGERRNKDEWREGGREEGREGKVDDVLCCADLSIYVVMLCMKKTWLI